MKTDLLITSARLSLLLLIGELLHYVGADAGNAHGGLQSSDYYYYNNNQDPYNNNNNMDNYGYSNYNSEPHPPPNPADEYIPSVSCFTCTLIQHDGHISGTEGCQDPFERINIPGVDCKGPCGKIYHQHGEKDFMMQRGCLPKCKEHRDDKSYTQCCTTSYCNIARSHHSFNFLALLVSITLTFLLSWR